MSESVQPLHLALLSTVLLRAGYYLRAASAGTEIGRPGYVVHHSGNVRLYFPELAGVEGLARSAGLWPVRNIPGSNDAALVEMFGESSSRRSTPYVVTEPVGPSSNWIERAAPWTPGAIAAALSANRLAVSLNTYTPPHGERLESIAAECHGVVVVDKFHTGGRPVALVPPSALCVAADGAQQWVYLFNKPVSVEDGRRFRVALTSQGVCASSPTWMWLPTPGVCAFARFDASCRYDFKDLVVQLGVHLGGAYA